MEPTPDATDGVKLAQAGTDTQAARERLNLPFGELLVREGLVPREEIDRVVALQVAEARRGVFLRLGELVVARGLLDEQAVARVLAMQGRPILVCPSCLAQFNVVDWAAGRAYACNRCEVALEVPQRVERLAVEDTLAPHEARASGMGSLTEQPRQFGPYLILGEISRGGMGVIYKARQRTLDRIVAMKVMSRPDRGEDAERFLREARAVARLRHPYIVAIHEIGRIEGVDYFTMDYIEGLPLNRAAPAEGLTPREIVEIFVKICDAVDYAHGQGVLHRDLKPSNIIIDRKREPVLIDFGIADLDVPSDDGDHIVGSPAFLPPEYIQGTAPFGISGEVYSIGASLYTILSGRPPHTGIDTVQVLRRAQLDDVTPIRRVRRTLDRDLATIVMTALERQAQARYATVRDLRNDLARWLEGEEVAGRRSPLVRLWQRVRGRVAAALGIATALLMVVSSLTYSINLKNMREQDQERMEQLDRDTRAMQESLVQARLEQARLLILLDRAPDANALLTDLLMQAHARTSLSRIHSLRAEARTALGDDEGAALDRKAAAAIGAVRSR